VGGAVADVRRRLESADVKIPLLVDERGAPLGWLSERALAGDVVGDQLRSGPEPIVDEDDVLRDALSDLLAHESQYGPVVDGEGRVVGVLSIELLSHMIATEESA
jgi:CBS domain-containing protein